MKYSLSSDSTCDQLSFGLWTNPPQPASQPSLQQSSCASVATISMAACLRKLESALQSEAPPCSIPICAAIIYASFCVGILFCVTLLIIAWLIYALC